MSLQKMLEYQKKDIVYYRQEKELKESEERKRAVLCKNKFMEYNNSLQELSKSLTSVNKLIQKLSEKILETESLKQYLTKDIEKFESQAEIDAYEEKLSEFEKSIDELSKELAKNVKSLSDISLQNKTINAKMDALNREYILSTQAYNKKKAIFEESTKDIREELAQMAKEIEPNYLAKYSELRKARKMPAFVFYMDKNCGACGMDISIEVDKKLQNPGDIAECPHCGRIVFKK